MMEPVLEAAGLTKRFGGVVALDGFDLRMFPGEIQVLLGENGAGKSTLIALLSGLQQPDAGFIRVAGKPVAICSPEEAWANGIGTVYQHSMLVPTLRVHENFSLGLPWWRLQERTGLKARANALALTLGMDIQADRTVASLSMGERQQTEILRVLLRGSRILILDEPTAMLTPQGVEALRGLLRLLADRGFSVLLVTHKLEEAWSFGDRITIMKSGRRAGSVEPDALSGRHREALAAEVLAWMFGSSSPATGATPPLHEEKVAAARPLLSVHDLSARGLAGVNLTVGHGEILGIAGIDGQGQQQLAEALAGQTTCRGRILLEGRDLQDLGVGRRHAAGLRYLTDDRLGEGLVGSLGIPYNLLLKRVGSRPFWRFGVERSRVIRSTARRLARAFDVRVRDIDAPAARLSGGNIQKLLLARELDEFASLIICNKPTHGLDLVNAQATRERVRKLARDGAGVLLISNDIEELLELSDRIAVMAGGAIAGTVPNGRQARSEIGRLMAGAG